LATNPPTVRALGNIPTRHGYFPTGIVYDRLGTAIVRQGTATTALLAIAAPLVP